MALKAHLEALQKKHQDIDIEIIAAIAAPSVDNLEVKGLKKKKLYLKDEIDKVGMKLD